MKSPTPGSQWWTLETRHPDGDWNDGPGRGGGDLDFETLIEMLNSVQ